MARYKGKLSDLVKDEIIKIINERGLRPGQQLPSEEQLAADLQVSRPTIRDALTLLESKGYLVRQHGRGTFLTEFSSFSSGLESWKSFPELIKEKGMTPSAEVLELSDGSFEEEIHAQLGLEINEACVKLERLRLADGKPVSYIINHFPRHLFGNTVLHEDLFNESLVVLLEEQFKVEFLYAMTKIKAVALDTIKARLLGVVPGTPSLLMDVVHYGVKDVPILLGKEWFLNDTVDFHIKRYRHRHSV